MIVRAREAEHLAEPAAALAAVAADDGRVGVPSLIHPCSVAVSWQSGHTCTSSAPSSGAKRTERSPSRRVRSQTAHCRSVETFVTLTRPTIAPLRSASRARYCHIHVCFTCRLADEGRPEGTRRHHRGRWHVLARVERFTEPALLLLLRERPTHGYDLLERLPELTGEARVEMGNLYRLLRALEEEGLVVSTWSDRQAHVRDHRARACSCSTSGPRRCAARRSAPNGFSNATRKGGDHAPPSPSLGRPAVLFRGGFPNRHELLERLESYQRDLEQQLADVADVIAHLRDTPRDPQAATQS